MIFIATFVEYEASTYGDYTFPAWADALGWIMAVAIILAIPITMLYQVNKEDEVTSFWGVSLTPILVLFRVLGYFLANHVAAGEGATGSWPLHFLKESSFLYSCREKKHTYINQMALCFLSDTFTLENDAMCLEDTRNQKKKFK